MEKNISEMTEKEILQPADGTVSGEVEILWR